MEGDKELRFYLDTDAPPSYRHRWEALRDRCERGCYHIETKDWVPLERVEGGITVPGCDQSNRFKQIRFRFDPNRHTRIYLDDAIVLLVRNSDESRWETAELTSIARAFAAQLERDVGSSGAVRVFLSVELRE